MKSNYYFVVLLLLMMSFTACQGQNKNTQVQSSNDKNMSNKEFKVNKTDEEWKATLSDEEYYVLRQAGTERPHSGKYNLHFEDGIYVCNACKEPLFESDTKFDAHCGWPSFDKAIPEKVIEKLDKSHGMTRMEILCANCGSHLGHVFNDGPTETGLRYCMNSVSLDFEGEDEASE